MSIRRFDHAVVAVRDLAAAQERFTALLGRGPTHRGQHPVWGTDYALFVFDNGGVELLSPARAGVLSDRIAARLAGDGEGLCGLALGCSDLAATARELGARGLRVGAICDGASRDEGARDPRHFRVATLHEGDTRGLWVQLTEPEGGPVAPPLPEASPGSAQALDHLVVVTADPAGTISRYRDGLGLRLALDRTFEERGLRLLFFRFGGMTLEFSALLGTPPGDESPDRFHGLAFRVEDALAAHAGLTRGGFDLSPLRDGHKPGTRVFTLREGIHGVPTLLIQDPTRARATARPRPVDP